MFIMNKTLSSIKKTAEKIIPVYWLFALI